MKILTLLIILTIFGWLATLVRAYFKRHPETGESMNFVSCAVALLGLIFVGLFVVELFSPVDVRLTIGFVGNRIELWSIGLVGSLVWLFVSWPLLKETGTL